MQSLLNELLIFKKNDDSRVLFEAADVVDAADESLRHRAANRFVKFVLEMTERHGFRGNLWKSCVAYYIAFNENAFSLREERKRPEADFPSREKDFFSKHDCTVLRKLFGFDFGEVSGKAGAELIAEIMDYQLRQHDVQENLTEELKARLENAADDEAFYEEICRFYNENGVGTFGMHKAFTAAEKDGRLQLIPVRKLGNERLEDLIGYEVQKQMLTANTEAFLQRKPANNVLLYGDGGTGKSTSIRALLNQYGEDGLRIIQVYRHQMQWLPDIISKIRDRNYRFLIYMDDLSFEDFETEYKYLKAVIEGGLEPRPENVLIYATSNRRHFIKETWNDRRDEEHTGEIFRSDSLEEKRSLADRFGMQIYYGKPTKEEYHRIIDALASREGIQCSTEELHAEATKWEIRHGGVSGRSARQFIDYIKGMENETR